MRTVGGGLRVVGGCGCCVVEDGGHNHTNTALFQTRSVDLNHITEPDRKNNLVD